MKEKILDWVHPDAKSQVTVEYKNVGNEIEVVRVHTVLLSVSHTANVSLE